MIITCYNYNYNYTKQLQLHYNHVKMTRNHMALSIDDNDDLKETKKLQRLFSMGVYCTIIG